MVVIQMLIRTLIIHQSIIAWLTKSLNLFPPRAPKRARRYNKNQISNLFRNFEIIKLTYFNFFLFVPISLIIIFFKILNINFIKKVESSPNFLINKILFSIFMIEKKLIEFLDLPFGVSLLGLFKKND